MISRTEAERLAAACHALRADWPTASLMTFIGNRHERPLLDLTLELIFVAQTGGQTPGLIEQDGPWKQLARSAAGTSQARYPDPGEDCATCSQPADKCRHDDHDYTPRRLHAVTPMPANVRSILSAKGTQ